MRSIQRLETAGLSQTFKGGGQGLKFSVVLQKTQFHRNTPLGQSNNVRKYRASENPGFGCLCLVNAFVWIVPFIESSSPSKNLDFCPCAQWACIKVAPFGRSCPVCRFRVTGKRPGRAESLPFSSRPKPSRLTRGRAIQGRESLRVVLSLGPGPSFSTNTHLSSKFISLMVYLLPLNSSTFPVSLSERLVGSFAPSSR